MFLSWQGHGELPRSRKPALWRPADDADNAPRYRHPFSPVLTSVLVYFIELAIHGVPFTMAAVAFYGTSSTASTTAARIYFTVVAQ